MPIIVTSSSVVTPGATSTGSTGVTVPHFAFPFRMGARADGSLGVAINEQDSLDDITACVAAVVACPQGAWSDQPQFGVPPLLFSQAPVAAGLGQAIQRWEPRAAITVTETPDRLNDANRLVRVDVSSTQPDQ